MTYDTIWEDDTNTIKHHIQEGQEVNPFPEGHNKAARKRQDTMINMNTNYKNDPQKKNCLGTVSKIVSYCRVYITDVLLL